MAARRGVLLLFIRFRSAGQSMRKYLLWTIPAVAMALGGPARADMITNLQLYDGGGAPTAIINYTNANGTGMNTVDVYADPQVSYGTTNPMFYCVDLWHDNYIGSSYTITPVSSMAFSESKYTDVDNRIGWLLSQNQSTADERAAVQLAIWYTIDNKPTSGFSMTTSDSTITNDYNNLISFTGYNPSVTYDAQFWQATHDSSNTLYQSLVSEGPSVNVNVSSVPEPNTLVMSFISVLALGLVHWCRGRR
jgi:hypothetical protein